MSAEMCHRMRVTMRTRSADAAPKASPSGGNRKLVGLTVETVAPLRPDDAAFFPAGPPGTPNGRTPDGPRGRRVAQLITVGVLEALATAWAASRPSSQRPPRT